MTANDRWGSASILLAAAGMLPVLDPPPHQNAFQNSRARTARSSSKLSGHMPDCSGQHARAPRIFRSQRVA